MIVGDAPSGPASCWRLWLRCRPRRGGTGVAERRAARRRWPARRVNFPPYQLRTLANGLQVLFVPYHEQPAVELPAARPRRRRAGAGRSARRGQLRGVAARPGHDHAVRRRRSRPRLIRPAASLGAGSGNELTYISGAVDQGSDRRRPGAGRPTWCSIPRSAGEEIALQRRAGAVGAAGRLRRSGLPGRRRLRPPGVRPSPVRPAERRHARLDRPPHARRSVAFHRALVRAEQRAAGHRRRPHRRRGVRRGRAGLRRLGPTAPCRRSRRPISPPAARRDGRSSIGRARRRPRFASGTSRSRAPIRTTSPFDLAIRILGGEGANRLFGVLRSDRGLTYGASADLQHLQGRAAKSWPRPTRGRRPRARRCA